MQKGWSKLNALTEVAQYMNIKKTLNYECFFLVPI